MGLSSAWKYVCYGLSMVFSSEKEVKAAIDGESSEPSEEDKKKELEAEHKLRLEMCSAFISQGGVEVPVEYLHSKQSEWVKAGLIQ